MIGSHRKNQQNAYWINLPCKYMKQWMRIKYSRKTPHCRRPRIEWEFQRMMKMIETCRESKIVKSRKWREPSKWNFRKNLTHLCSSWWMCFFMTKKIILAVEPAKQNNFRILNPVSTVVLRRFYNDNSTFPYSLSSVLLSRLYLLIWREGFCGALFQIFLN